MVGCGVRGPERHVMLWLEVKVESSPAALEPRSQPLPHHLYLTSRLERLYGASLPSSRLFLELYLGLRYKNYSRMGSAFLLLLCRTAI